jgi:uncharacterized protein YprB with RNaseH-like and TPR domain
MRSFDPDERRADESDDGFAQRPNSVFAFKEQLRRDYEGLTLTQVIPGRVVRNDYGSCYHVSGRSRAALRRGNGAATRQDLLNSVSLVRGIRERTGEKLASQGIRSLRDLENHPRFGPESRRLRELIEAGSTEELAEVVGSRLSRSHPSVLGLSGLHRDSDFVFLDIETMGMFAGQPIVVAGLAVLEAENVCRVHQYVVRDFPDELALVHEVGRALSGRGVLVTYNGKTFDLPFLTGRAAYYGLRFASPSVHFDLLHFCRRAWKGELESCTLRSIEQSVLGTSRDSDLPGEYVPEFYQEYLRTRNAGFLKPIVDHNRQDVASLVNVFSTLVEYWSERDGNGPSLESSNP